MSNQDPGSVKQPLQLIKRADGKTQVLGLLPGQKIIHQPNGGLLLVKPCGAKVPLVVTMATKPPSIDSREAATHTIFIGDKIRLDPEFALKIIQSRNGSEEAIRKFVEMTVGTVSCVNVSSITVQFPYLGRDIFFRFDAPCFRLIEKLNPYSINQLIKMKSDALTVAEMEKQFQHHTEQLKGAFGEVIGIDPSGKVVIRFDDPEIHQSFSSNLRLPSAWMDPVQPTNPAFNKELLDLASTEVALFLKVVDGGDLRSAQQLHIRRGVDVETRNAQGMTALHVTSEKGYYDMTKWLLEIKVDINIQDYKGYCPVHYAALGGHTEIMELLKKHNADPNIQDAEGNTPLHVAVMKGKSVDGLIRTFNLNLGLLNANGLNAIQMAVVYNNLDAVKSILATNELCDALYELMPKTKWTILHQICVDKNHKMAKLLLEESNDVVLLDRPLKLKKLLEAKDGNGSTPLLIACFNRDYAMVEILVESGADVNAADGKGNTTILWAASSSELEEIPTKELSPEIFKLYESALEDSTEIKAMMESHPILSLIAYLMKKGASLETANKDGIIGRDIVIGIGSPASVIVKLLEHFLLKSLAEASGGSICMGEDCNQQPVNRLQCPHQPTFAACSKCFALHFKQMKCGCEEEDVVSIQPPCVQQLLDLSRSYQKEKPAPISQPDLASFTFEWIREVENGYLLDQMGNKYTFMESEPGLCRRFRCDKGPNFKERCTAVALAIKKEDCTEGIFPEEVFTYCLEKPHNHPVALKRKIVGEDGSEAGPSSSQKKGKYN